MTGASIRSLYAGFQSHRGCSPMDFLREPRLSLVRSRRLSSPGSTVAQIALEFGFEHLGPFRAEDRARFGEGEAETRKRVRRTARDG